MVIFHSYVKLPEGILCESNLATAKPSCVDEAPVEDERKMAMVEWFSPHLPSSPAAQPMSVRKIVISL